MAATRDRVALVTGASSGIGEAAARALVGAGFTVYGTSRTATPGEKRGDVVFLPLDVTDESRRPPRCARCSTAPAASTCWSTTRV